MTVFAVLERMPQRHSFSDGNGSTSRRCSRMARLSSEATSADDVTSNADVVMRPTVC